MTPARGMRAALALLIAIFWVVTTVAGAAPALAHAVVATSSPADGARLATAPAEVRITFGEAVDAPIAALKVYGATSERVDLDDAGVVPGDQRTVRATLAPNLPDGPYVVIWRAVGLDGHTVIGKLDFRVGDWQGVAAVEVPASVDDSGLATASLALRVLVTVGTMLAAGAGAFYMLALRSRPRSTWAGPQDAVKRWVRRGAIVALVASVASLPVEAAVRAGVMSLDTIGPSLVAVINTPFGMMATARALVLLPFVLGIRTTSRGLVWTLWAVSLLTLAADGHGVTVSPVPVTLTADMVHLAAGAIWFGGLVGLGAVLRRARDHGDAIGMADVVARFSAMALWAVVAASAAGAVLAWLMVESVEGLTSSTYGATLTAKVMAVGAVVAIGAYNRRMLVPRIIRSVRAVPAGAAVDSGVLAAVSISAAPDAMERLRRTVAFEAVALVWVLVLTAVLVAQPTPDDQPAAPSAPVECALGGAAEQDAVLAHCESAGATGVAA